MIAKDTKTIKTDLYHKNTSLADHDKTSSTLFQEKKWIFYEEICKIYWPKSYNPTGITQTNPPNITKLQYSTVVN